MAHFGIPKRLQRWALRLAIATAALGGVGGFLWYIDSRTGHSRSISAYIIWRTRYEAWKIREPSKPWKGAQDLNAGTKTDAGVIYQKSKVWRVDLSFSAEGWKGLTPQRFEPMSNFWLPNGLFAVRNPAAPRSGLLGVMGYPFMRFVEARAKSVRGQLDGKSAGIIVKLPAER